MQYTSKVYFARVSESDQAGVVEAKLADLIDKSRLLDFIAKDSCTAVKMHFGEEGNTGHVRPEYAGTLCRKIISKGSTPFLADTNTLYKGRRTTSADHIKLAHEHGFTKAACSAEVVVPDDTNDGNVSDVSIDGNFFKTAKVASLFLKADSLIGLAHFKGHIMTGFGGSLKNIGMGCASREGKLAQHSEVTPVIDLAGCKGCMECVKSCPVNAIYSRVGHVVIDPAKCIGCATCIAVCPHGAIEVDWESGGSSIQEKMVEYAAAVLLRKKGKQAFINFATKITKECDCLAKDDPRIIPDIGIFASKDPVSLDKACYDACFKESGKDIFKA
ncbi:MAG: DUF362 domain-containing protein, partial [Candidatus Omnitrophica bacterium]|nr:DUF362 domain-containing protein [Candidatus Omnitrophota bacterium]